MGGALKGRGGSQKSPDLGRGIRIDGTNLERTSVLEGTQITCALDCLADVCSCPELRSWNVPLGSALGFQKGQVMCICCGAKAGDKRA